MWKIFQIGAQRRDFYDENLRLRCQNEQECRSSFSLRPKFSNHMLMTQPIAGTNLKVGKSRNLTTAWIWPLDRPSYFAPTSLLVKQTTCHKMSVVLMMGPSGARKLWYGGFGSDVQCVQACASRHKCSSAPTC